MCGIAGAVGVEPPDRALILRMLEAIRHRGPDGEGSVYDSHAAFGHRRLAIIDLEGGAQPLFSADRSIWLIANGEIYNHVELRQQLAMAGIRLQTASDCEVIIGLYQLYGDELLGRLRGMYAFALWDSRRRRLLLARDHLGQKPLFYTVDSGQLRFASEIKALVGAVGNAGQIELRALDQYLALRLIAPPLSMHAGVLKLPPGHKLVYEPGSLPLVSPYWELTYQEKFRAPDAELLDRLEQQVVEALKLHMVSDVEVGAYLSGGLDSGLLVAYLVKYLGIRDLKTFTLALPYRKYSEGPAAKRVSARFGTRHREILFHGDLLKCLPDLLWHLDEPSDPLALCNFVLAREVRRDVKVAIGGDGGDELFAGYDRYWGYGMAERLARAPPSVLRAFGRVVDLLPATGWYKGIGHKLRWLQQSSQLQGAARHSASLGYFHFDAAMRAELLHHDVIRKLAGWRGEEVIESVFEATNGDALDKMLHVDSVIRLPDHPVMISDRMSMAHGLEVRSPFMDHKLVEFCARLPSTLKIRGRRLRFAQRQLAARVLPSETLRRPKQGLSSAFPYMLREQLNALYRAMGDSSALVDDEILNAAPMRSLIQAHVSGRQDHGARLWLIANAELWYRTAVREQSRDTLRETLGDWLKYYSRQTA